jgi:hypothetical protein
MLVDEARERRLVTLAKCLNHAHLGAHRSLLGPFSKAWVAHRVHYPSSVARRSQFPANGYQGGHGPRWEPGGDTTEERTPRTRAPSQSQVPLRRASRSTRAL